MNKRNFIKASLLTAATYISPTKIAMANDGFLELVAGQTNHNLYKNVASRLWTYNGALPGPEIRVRRGERVRVRFVNQLDEPSSIHWHGIRIDNNMDGVSGLTQKAVEPGASFEYDFVTPDAGTYWYHAHNKSWNQVTRGLYGPLIVEEHHPPLEEARDITLVVDDWRLNRSGQFDQQSLGSMMDWSHAGRLGNWLTVNGTSLPTFKLKQYQNHRIRLINACNARTLRIDPNRFDAKIVALDGQSLPKAVRHTGNHLPISTAQRVDLLVTPQEAGNFAIEEVSSDDPFEFARFLVEAADPAPTVAKPVFPPNSIPEPDLASAATQKLHMSGGAMGRFDEIRFKGKVLTGEDFRNTKQFWAFNGIANLSDKSLFSVQRGMTIIIEAFNDTAFDHAIHLHGHHFKVVEISSDTNEMTGVWRDTILLHRQQRARLAFVADNPGKWLIHCHMLEHAAAGMNNWFEVS